MSLEDEVSQAVVGLKTFGVPVDILLREEGDRVLIQIELREGTARLLKLLMRDLAAIAGPLTEDGLLFSKSDEQRS